MVYQEEKKGKVMTNYGRYGDTFHILLKGKCSVWLPIQADKTKVVSSFIELV